MSACCGEIVYEGLCVRGRSVKVMDCVVCGFRHLHPKPTAEELDTYYRERYFTTEKPDYAANSGTGSEYQLLVDRAKIEAAIDRKSWRGRPGPRVLDYGCGPSAPFLMHFHKIWSEEMDHYSDEEEECKLFGVEPSQSKPMVELFSKATVFPNLKGVPRAKFDIIHLGFVLEHVANPHKILLKLKDWMEPDGSLIVEVPNDWNPLQLAIWKRDGGDPWWVSSPDHVNAFSTRSLRELFYDLRFRVVALGTTFPVELFLLLGLDFRKDETAKQAVVERRAALQRFWGDSQWRVDSSVGRTVWMVATCR